MIRNTKGWRDYLTGQGYSGQINEAIRKWALDNGGSGQFNNAVRRAMTSLGFLGTFNEQVKQFEDQYIYSSFSPSSLFSVSDNGASFDIGVGSLELAAGVVTEASVGDPVGFQLDQSKGVGFSNGVFTGLGAEAHSDPSFDDAAEWTTSNWVVADGTATITDPDASYTIRSSTDTLTSGTWYAIQFTVDSLSGGLAVRFRDNDAGDNYFPFGVGTHYLVIQASGTQPFQLRPQGSGTGVIVVSEFSVKEIPGNHASQLVSASRPTLRQSGSVYYIEFDGIDDFYPLAASGLLGTTWSHVGAWSVDQTAYLFSASEDFRGAVRQGGAGISWVDEDSNQSDINNAQPNEKHILSIDRDGNTSLSGRKNGGVVTTIVPFDDSANNPGGLYISSSDTDRYFNSGVVHWHGGLWIDRILTDTERQSVEAYYANLSGVSL